MKVAHARTNVTTASAGAFLVVALVVAGSQFPILLAAIPGIGLLALASIRSWARLLIVTVGGLLVFQSSSAGSRTIYLAAALFCIAISMVRLGPLIKRSDALRCFLPMLAGSTLLFVACCIGLVVGLRHGASYASWTTAVFPYLILAILPIVGLEASTETSDKFLNVLVYSFVFICPLAFMTDWLHRRGVSSLDVGRIAFGSVPLCIFGMAIAIGKFADARPGRRLQWLLVAIYAPLCVLLTGTRSAIAMLGGVLGAMGSSGKKRLPTLLTLASGTFIALALYLGVQAAGPLLTTNPAFYHERFTGLPSILTNGASELNSDQSYQGRAIDTHIAVATLDAHPLLGQGIGADPYISATQQTFDTPFATLMRFGILGTLLITAWIASWAWAALRLQRLTGYQWFSTSFRVFAVSLLFYLPLTALLDDKGFGLAMTLWGALLPNAGQLVIARRADVGYKHLSDVASSREQDGVTTGSNQLVKTVRLR